MVFSHLPWGRASPERGFYFGKVIAGSFFAAITFGGAGLFWRFDG
jgi:hypothetical protein